MSNNLTSLCASLFNAELFRRAAIERCAFFKGITVAFSGRKEREEEKIVKVINVKHAPELCLTDAFTSSASEAALARSGEHSDKSVSLENGQSSLGWRCLEITRRRNVCRFQ